MASSLGRSQIKHHGRGRFVFHFDQRAGISRLVERDRDYQRDRLTLVMNLVVPKPPTPRSRSSRSIRCPVQNPHWNPSCSMNANWSGWSIPFCSSPSIVVIFLPSCIAVRVMQDKTRRPLMCTVHAPHSPRSHAFFVPVNAVDYGADARILGDLRQISPILRIDRTLNTADRTAGTSAIEPELHSKLGAAMWAWHSQFAARNGGEFRELHCGLDHVVEIKPSLRPKSPKNGSFPNVRRRQSAISHRKC
jgi:hypothetical protein